MDRIACDIVDDSVTVDVCVEDIVNGVSVVTVVPGVCTLCEGNTEFVLPAVVEAEVVPVSVVDPSVDIVEAVERPCVELEIGLKVTGIVGPVDETCEVICTAEVVVSDGVGEDVEVDVVVDAAGVDSVVLECSIGVAELPVFEVCVTVCDVVVCMFAVEALVDSNVDVVSRVVVGAAVLASVVVDSCVCEILEGVTEADVDIKVVSVTVVEVGGIVLWVADIA